MATFEEIQKQNLQKYIQQTGNQDAQARLNAWNTGGKDPGAGYKATSQAIQQTASNPTIVSPYQDLFKQYNTTINSGFENAESLAQQQASRIANEKRNALNSSLQSAQTNRDIGLKGVENSLAGAKQSLEDTSFQKYLAARQAMSNRGLSGSGLAQDQDTRLALSRQRDLAGIERDAADRRYALDAMYNDQSKAINDQMANIDESGLYNELFAQYRTQEMQQRAQQAGLIQNAINMMRQQQMDEYGMKQDELARQDKQDAVKREYNWAMAKQFADAYGIPIAPKDDIKNLQAQVAGRPTLNDLDRQYKYDSMNNDNYWKQQDQKYRYDNMNADQQYRYDNLAQDNYWKQQDQAYRYDNMNQDNYWKQQDFALKEQEIMGKMAEEKDKFVKDEVSGMMNALREGLLSPEQAYQQLKQDSAAGIYTPEQAKKLESVLRVYQYSTPPSSGGKYGPPIPSDMGFKSGKEGGDISSIISANEGNYSSVNANDNGAASIGKFQWRAGRAQEVLSAIKSTDPKTYRSILGGTRLDQEITSRSNWNKRVFNASESKLVSQLLNTNAGKKVQEQIASRDLNSYISIGKGLGIREQGALAYFADLYNQSPARAKQIAQKSNGSLASLHQTAMKDPVMSKYKSRRVNTYKRALN